MRNVFDQYETPENRVTHALLCALDADRDLLHRFLAWLGHPRPVRRGLQVLGQTFPGVSEAFNRKEGERKGIPDGCICDKDGWALLIESKIQAGVNLDQLRRHLRTAERHGLSAPALLLLTAVPTRLLPIDCVIQREWREVYRWLSMRENLGSDWAKRLRSYMEIAEVQLVADGYLVEGALTMFSGIPFGSGEDVYSYPQAKRLLRQLRSELVKDARLQQQLGIRAEGEGRPAITGAEENVVWDFIPLPVARGKTFTSHVHLTLGITPERLEAYVTVPNSLRAHLRNAFLGDSFESFADTIQEVTRRLGRVSRAAPNSVPMINVVQRHYRSQRSKPDIDSHLRFDPRTSLERRGTAAAARVKHQPEWLRAAYDALKNRQSNLQFQIGQDFPFATSPSVRKAEIVRFIADTWLSCRPLLDRIYGEVPLVSEQRSARRRGHQD